MMNVEAILQAFNEAKVNYILIGGMNFFLRHEPVSTYDVDLWIEDTPENKSLAAKALTALKAEWGRTEREWRPVGENALWMSGQGCFCLTSEFGAIDIFLDVQGLEGRFRECRQRALNAVTLGGTPYIALADIDMLRCQEALPPQSRKLDRMRVLQSKLNDGSQS